MAEASLAIDDMLVNQKFGGAGRRIVIQELLEGMEISLHALCDGRTALLFPAAQDHKRIGEKDTGPNTGGMGAYSPAPFLTDAELAGVERKILAPWLQGCQEEGIDFCGILYPGVMLTKDGPKVLEFNARFGDPETQAYLMRLENDLTRIAGSLRRTASGKNDAALAAGGRGLRGDGLGGLSRLLRERQTDPGIGGSRPAAGHKNLPRRDGPGRGSDRDQRRPGSWGDGAGRRIGPGARPGL